VRQTPRTTGAIEGVSVTQRKPTRAKALGIDDAEYARLLAAQGGHCALCPNTPKTRRLDHRPVVLARYRLPDRVRHRRHERADGVLPGVEVVTRAQRDARTTAERDAEIRRVRREFNWTYEHIASLYGITRQRAWQIVTKAGKA
jgi:hypothetical protein